MYPSRLLQMFLTSFLLFGCSEQARYSNELKEIKEQIDELTTSIDLLVEQQSKLVMGIDLLLAQSQNLSSESSIGIESKSHELSTFEKDDNSYVDLTSLSKSEIIDQYHLLRSQYKDREEFSAGDPEMATFIQLGLNNPQQLIELLAANPHDHYLLMALYETYDSGSAHVLMNFVETNYAILELAATKGLVQEYPEKFKSIYLQRLALGDNLPPTLIEKATEMLDEDELQLVVDYAINGVNKNRTVALLHDQGYENAEQVALQAFTVEEQSNRINDYDLVMLSYELARMGNYEGLKRFHGFYVGGYEPDIQWGRLIRNLFEGVVSPPDFEQNALSAMFNENNDKWYF